MINLPAIIIANGAGIMLMLAILLSSSRMRTRYGLLDERLFHLMIAFTVLQCFIEPCTFFIDGKEYASYRELSLILNCALYMFNIAFAFVWTVYVDYKVFGSTERLRRIYPFVAIPALFVCIASLINLFTPVFFTVSEANVYTRTGLYVIPYAFTYLYLMYGVVLAYLFRKKSGKYLVLPAIVFMIPIAVGSVLQFMFYGLSLVWLGVAIAVTSLYISVQNEASSLDTLSGLFSRQYLNSYLRAEFKRTHRDRVLAGIMLDIDLFKSINDTYGHLAGDDAIASVGEILRESVTDRGLATRYAGDEFMVVMLVQDESEVKSVIASIEKNTEALNASGKQPFDLHFSWGYTLREPEDTMDSFLHRMDAQMYVQKGARIRSHQLPDRREEAAPAMA